MELTGLALVPILSRGTALCPRQLVGLSPPSRAGLPHCGGCLSHQRRRSSHCGQCHLWRGVLERLGFTDALIRIFLPVMGTMGINPR